MNKFLDRHSPCIYGILRVVAGTMFMFHGTQKLFGIPGDKPEIYLFSILGFAGIIEFACGLMVALGLRASYAAFLASGEMAFAYFMVHFPRGFFPILNGGELAVIYCFVFLYISSQGSGIFSLDEFIATKK